MRALLLKINDKIEIQLLSYYIVIGGLSAAINILAFAILLDYFHFHYVLAVTLSYLIAIIFNFSSNRTLTFKSSGSDLTFQIFKYLCMSGINYLITLLVLHIVVGLLFLSPYFGLLCAIAVTTITGFTLSKYWVYVKS